MVSSLSVLGSTGSVGTQTLDVAARLGIPVKAISGNKNTKLLAEQARRFHPDFVCAYDEAAADTLKTMLADTDIRVGSGMSALVDCAAGYGECVVTAVSGSVGLTPTLAAIDEKKRIALANKETLVCAGSLVMSAKAGLIEAKTVCVWPGRTKSAWISSAMTFTPWRRQISPMPRRFG